MDDALLRGAGEAGFGLALAPRRRPWRPWTRSPLDLDDIGAHLAAARLVDRGAADGLAGRFPGGLRIGHELKVPSTSGLGPQNQTGRVSHPAFIAALIGAFAAKPSTAEGLFRQGLQELADPLRRL